MITLWRIDKARHAPEAFSGHGAMAVGGRWNRQGTPVVYTSVSLSLAAHEVLVHATRSQLRHIQYMRVKATVPEGVAVQEIGEGNLPDDWRRYAPSPPALQVLGEAWIAAGKSAILKVPSAVIPGEFNYLLNPRHPDFGKIRIGTPEPFPFDPRVAG